MDILNKFKPATRKVWLYLLAGFLWFSVGLMLIGFASRWLKPHIFFTLLLLASAGILLAGGIYLFGFSKLAKKNIKRINGMESEKVCLFAFQGWKSYPLILFMISLGIYLRIYSPVPKSLLAILYLGIGGGLLFSSLHYFVWIVQLFTPQKIMRQ